MARESGVTYYFNRRDGTISASPIEFDLTENSVPLSVALGDINRDGWPDIVLANLDDPLRAFMNKGGPGTT